MILAPFGGPSCGHVGDIFGKNGATLWGPPGFYVVLLYVIEFWRFWNRFGTDFGPSGTDFGQMLGRCWAILGRFLDED